MATGSVHTPKPEAPPVAAPFSLLKLIGPQLGAIVGDLMAPLLAEVSKAAKAAGYAEARLEWIVDVHERDVTKQVAAAVAHRDEKIAELESALRGAFDEREQTAKHVEHLTTLAHRSEVLADELAIAKAERDAIEHERDVALGRPVNGRAAPNPAIVDREHLFERVRGLDLFQDGERLTIDHVRDWTRSETAAVREWLEGRAARAPAHDATMLPAFLATSAERPTVE